MNVWLTAPALLLVGITAAMADPAYDRCIKQSDGTNTAWGACGAAMIEREDTRLNAAWQRVYPLLEAEGQKALQAEQRAWIAYKDKSCLFYAGGEYGREGQVLDYPVCRAAVIAGRTRELVAIEKALNQR